ncbi:MAG: ATP-binding cassette domain-containing protein [Acidimicrobiales bacterium]
MRSLVVDDIAVRYGEVEAVRGASCSVEAGQVFGLLGPNGAGKTSIMRVLAHPGAAGRREGLDPRP